MITDQEGDYEKSQVHHGMKWTSPAVVAIFTAALGLFGNLVVALINNMSSIGLEERKFQRDLLLQEINLGNPQEACGNLTTFMRIGVMHDPKGEILRGICTNPTPDSFLFGLASTSRKESMTTPLTPGAGASTAPTGAVTNPTITPRLVPGPPITPKMVVVRKVDSGNKLHIQC
jgi:hypothetical protein